MNNRTFKINIGTFTQRTRTFYDSNNGLLSNTVLCVTLDKNNAVFAGTKNGLCINCGNGFKALNDDMEINSLFCDKDNIIWFSSDSKIGTYSNQKIKLLFEAEEKIVGIAQDDTGIIWALGEDHLFRITDGKIERKNSNEGKGQCITACGDAKVFVGTTMGLLALVGKRKHWSSLFPQTTNVLSNDVKAVSIDKWGQILYGTDKGAGMYDNKSYWFDCRNSEAFTKEAVNCIAVDSVGGKYYGTDIGLIYQHNGTYSHWTARRWLPDEKVNDIAVTADGKTIWAATDAGLSEIVANEMTLEEKAEYYQNVIEKYHVRKDGFVTVRNLYDYENIENGDVEITDNDGLWTQNYVAALSFKYAVTKDEKTLEAARRSMKAMLKLMYITGIPGFTARAIRYKGEPGYGNGDPEWPLAPDKSCEWKCETSSDEMTGHFFGMSLYYDLCADDSEKEEIKKAVCAIVDHIIENDYRLVDHDGLPTTWAMWSPKCLNEDSKWCCEKGTNSLEILAFLKVAYHMSGDEKYQTEYDKFIIEYHYAMNIGKHKIKDAHVCHIDDNLSFLNVYTFSRYEKDPDIRALMFMGLEDHWQYERIERSPLFDIIYGVLTNRPCDLDIAIQSMIELPLDLTHYNTVNSKRKDLIWDTQQAEWGEEPQLLRPLPYDEKPVEKYDSNPFIADRTHGGFCVEDGTIFLLPYWLGRYEGLID